VKVTSGGIERGARPICDGRCADAEKDLDELSGNAGRRNDGNEIRDGEVVTLSIPFARAVESIVGGLCFRLH
jgi:hypothetical protein